MGIKKKLAMATASLAVIVGAVGVLHMPFARGLLMRAGGCPVGHAKLAELEPARLASIAKDRGSEAAPARPALGFHLDETTPKDVRAWADRVNVSCAEVREGLLRCKDVTATSVGLPERDGPIAELYFGFNTHGRLVDVSTMRMHVDDATKVRDVEARLESQVGAPHEKSGSFDPEHLALEGVFSLSTARYRYSDYFAEVIAMRFASDGLVLREHYMSAKD
jgi:hypothetical protein